jgi:AmiR/NasT family two-component response regulator
MNMQNGETQSDRVAQASGMVSVQAECSVDEAFAMIEERARTIDLTAEEVADSVVDRRFRFSIRS